MEKKTETPDVAQLRQMAPHRDALFSSTMNGVSNALMLATPAFVVLDKGEKYINENIKWASSLTHHKGKITVGIGAVFGLAGLMQGLGEASRLKQYREARLDYSNRLEKRLEALEETAARSWTEKAESPATSEQGPAR